MSASGYASRLHERLGDAGIAELSEIFAAQKEDIVTLVEARFERRLADECGKLRGELRAGMDALRIEFRAEMKDLRADFKAENGTLKADLIKWSFLFWLGQAAFVLGMISTFRP